MSNNLWKRIGVILLIVLATISFALIYKWMVGTHIRHYKQYILQCRGRISTSSNFPTNIRFCVLDEEEISELSNKENIMKIHLITDKGDALVCDDWDISDKAGFYNAGTYSAKELNVMLTVTHTVIVEKIEIVYEDQKELFDIGNLTIEPMTLSEFEARTQIISYVSGGSAENTILSNHVDYFMSDKSYLYLSANTLGAPYQIVQIEFGIEGVGFDPSTLKKAPSNMDFGQSFMEDPENEAYLSASIVEQLPKQEINLNVESSGSEFTNAIIGLMKTKEYDESMVVNYYSPVFMCVDVDTGTEYRYANMNYLLDAPVITSEKFAKKLLEEYGR